MQVFTLLNQLQKLPTLKIFAVILNYGELSKRLTNSGIDVRLIDERSNSFFKIVNEADNFCRKKQIDLVHSHRYKENIVAAHLKKRGATNHIIQTIHGEGEPFKGIDRIKATISTTLNRYYTQRNFDRIITVSEDLKSRTKAWFVPERISAIHNSINLQDITPSKDATKLKSELGIEANRPVIGTAGRLVPVKGYDTLLETAQLVCASHPETVFVLAGDGPLRSELEAKCKELNLSDNFKFLGFRHDIIDLTNMLDIFIMSSHNEGIPVILLEAMSMAKPVVATSVGGIPEVIQDGKAGFLVSPGDPQALCRACLKLLENDELKRTFGENGKERIEAKFQVAQQAERVAAVYRDICKE